MRRPRCVSPQHLRIRVLGTCLAIALVPALAGCASLPPTMSELEGDRWRHEPTGIVFPEEAGEFSRYGDKRAVHAYDPEAHDVSVPYSLLALTFTMKPQATAYAFPKNRALSDEWKQTIAEIGVHKEFKMLDESDCSKLAGGKACRRARFRFRGPAALSFGSVAVGYSRPQEGEVVLIDMPKGFLKLRMSVHEDDLAKTTGWGDALLRDFIGAQASL